MSETETHVGKAKLLFPRENQSLESLARELCELNDYKSSYCDTYEQVLHEEGYRKYVVLKDSILEILEDRTSDDDLCFAKQNPDGTLDYFLQYYNGGCSFGEALESALKKMKS